MNTVFIKHGVYFLTVGALLFATTPSSWELYGIRIPAMVTPSQVLGAIAIVFSAVCMAATFWKRLAAHLDHLLKDEIELSPYTSFVRFAYWLLFWVIYTIGWLRALPGIMDLDNKVGVYAVFYVGLLWFLIIPAVWLGRPTVRAVRPGVRAACSGVRSVSRSKLWRRVFR